MNTDIPTVVKERPILFSGPMVRAILEGRKTQTRRVVKPQPGEGLKPSGWVMSSTFKPNVGAFAWLDQFPLSTKQHHVHCPYGKPGERLWVKETHLPKRSGTIYRADFDECEAAGIGGMYGGWKPSIFCRRKDSRILLEVVSVRVERLQEISEADAMAEGCDGKCPVGYEPVHRAAPCAYHYAQVWESIHGAGSWEKNPWVWVVEFRRVEA